MLWISSTSQRLAGLTSNILNDEAFNSIGEELKAPVDFAQQSALPYADSRTRARVTETYGKLPLTFEANEGQVDSRVKFVSRAGGATLFLTPTEAVLRREREAPPSRPDGQILAAGPFVDRAARLESKVESAASVLRMKLVGANASARVAGADELPGKSNYFIGNDPQNWRVNVPNYAKVKYEQVYPGIDLVYYGNQRQLEYDFIVASGADPNAISLAFKGAERMRVANDGNLILTVCGREIQQYKPVAYQEVNGVRRTIAARYVVQRENQVGFAVERYQLEEPLIIDPVLAYSTYLGGSSDDLAFGIAVDSVGNAYVTGYTESSDFPMAGPGRPLGALDVFVTKLNLDRLSGALLHPYRRKQLRNRLWRGGGWVRKRIRNWRDLFERLSNSRTDSWL